MENPKSRLSLDQSSSSITRSARSSSSNNSGSSGGSSAVQAAATGGAAASPPHHCGGCGKVIKDRYLLQALDSYWHEDCLKCGCCDCRLGEVGSTLYTRANLILCKRDYLRLFGATGNCAACCKMIPAFEMVMRAKNNVYHMECFACHQCHQRFCVGDRFFLCDNKILCEYDYEERIIFANMANNPANLSMIQNQVNDPQAMESIPPSGMRNDCRTSAWNTSASRNPEVLSVTASSARSSGRHPLAPHTQNPININNNNINNPHSNNHKQDSPAPEDASSSGYGSPDSGMAEDG